MSRKRNRHPLIEGLEITGFAAEGKAMGRYNDIVVFVPMTTIGDIVDVQIKCKRRRYMEGEVVRFVKRSDMRVEPFCEHYGVCGGCKWQHIPYSQQLQLKQKQVVDQLTHIGKIELPEISPIIGSDNTTFYRNKLEYAFSYKRWMTREEVASDAQIDDLEALGFHIPNMFDKILDIKKCWLQEDPSNQIRLAIKEFALKQGYTFYNVREHSGLMRNIIIRTASTSEIMLIVVFGEDKPQQIETMMKHIAEQFPQITSLMYVVNTKFNDTIGDLDIICYKGRDYIFENMEDLRFKVGPKSFYQTNSAQAYKLYSVVRDMAALSGNEVVYDLYTGTGTIANFVASKASKVIGIEYVPEAIEDAKVNSAINNVTNTSFFAGDMKDIFTDEFIKTHGHPDTVILDPPRAGIHENVAEAILNAAPKRLVYVSCNPATQARDLAILDRSYRVIKVQPVDMFPHTQHVENVVLLELREA